MAAVISLLVALSVGSAMKYNSYYLLKVSETLGTLAAIVDSLKNLNGDSEQWEKYLQPLVEAETENEQAEAIKNYLLALVTLL